MLRITTFIKMKQFAFIIILFHSTSIIFIWWFFDLSLLFCFYRNGVPWRRESEWRPTSRVYICRDHFFVLSYFYVEYWKSIVSTDWMSYKIRRITDQPKTNQVCAVNCKFCIILEANVHCKGHLFFSILRHKEWSGISWDVYLMTS